MMQWIGKREACYYEQGSGSRVRTICERGV